MTEQETTNRNVRIATAVALLGGYDWQIGKNARTMFELARIAKIARKRCENECNYAWATEGLYAAKTDSVFYNMATLIAKLEPYRDWRVTFETNRDPRGPALKLKLKHAHDSSYDFDCDI